MAAKTFSANVTPGRDCGDETDRLEAGMDFRRPEYRREVWHRFYEHQLRRRAHPGGVYFLIPYLAARYGWGPEDAMWFAFLNGCTQHPPMSLITMRRFPTVDQAGRIGEWWSANFARIRVDTDRRHHKAALPAAAEAYRDTCAGDQRGYWRDAAAGGWDTWWHEATRLPSFGRLSAWSFADYQHIAGVEVEPPHLMLYDLAGSRSHRNGLAIVCGREDLDWHADNPTFAGYNAQVVDWLGHEGDLLLAEARARHAGADFWRDINRLTVESALCTYKSWHRPNRRYPGVYCDMLHDRLVETARLWPDEDLQVFWDARHERLPKWLRLEDRPADPGCQPTKQNWYRQTGQVVTLGYEWECFENDFDALVDAGRSPDRPG